MDFIRLLTANVSIEDLQRINTEISGKVTQVRTKEDYHIQFPTYNVIINLFIVRTIHSFVMIDDDDDVNTEHTEF